MTIKKISSAMIALSLLICTPAFAKTMKEALDEAAEYFVKTAVHIEQGQELHVVAIVNYQSGEQGLEGKRIETEMFFALERQFPDFKLFLGKGENTEKEIYLAGTYEKKANTMRVNIRIVKGN